MQNSSRRNFLRTSLATAAGLAVLPGFNVLGANNTINLGFIGVGKRSLNLMRGMIKIPGVRVVATSDVYARKNQRFARMVKDYYNEHGEKVDVKMYKHYQDLLASKDVDAVVIATPDHWHALQAIDACKAGKDVYLEKPLTFTIQEGKELVKAVRKYNRVLAVGSQQRSDAVFQHAIKMVQSGRIGQLNKINAYVGAPPKPYDLPREIVPEDLDWDMWLGPNPYVHYNEQLAPSISLNPPKDEAFWGGWRWYKELGGGFTTDWGAHMFDIAQWAMGMDNSGPIEAIPAGFEDYNFLTYKYASGIVMTEEPFNEQKTKGVKFHGSDGWIEVSRGYYKASDPSLEPNAERGEGAYESKIAGHNEDFIQALRTRRNPQVTVEIGHRSCSVCTLGNIAYELGRPVRWNPAIEQFADDRQADLYMHREYRKGYKLPRI